MLPFLTEFCLFPHWQNEMKMIYTQAMPSRSCIHFEVTRGNYSFPPTLCTMVNLQHRATFKPNSEKSRSAQLFSCLQTTYTIHYPLQFYVIIFILYSPLHARYLCTDIIWIWSMNISLFYHSFSMKFIFQQLCARSKYDPLWPKITNLYC